MTNYDKQFLADQKQVLLSEKARISDEIKKLNQYPDYGDLEDDNPSELQDYEQNQSIADELKDILKKINTALSAIEKGTFGKCSKCNSLIDKGRLELIAYADICVSCKQHNEK